MNIGRRIAENAKAGKAIRSLAMEWGDLLLLGWLSFNIIVGILSLWPNPVGGGDWFQNLFEHFLAYMLSALGAALIFKTPGYVLPVGLTLIVGGGWLEVGQACLPNRHCDVDDFLANCAGVAVGLVLGAAIRALVARGKGE